ncbi:MAG: hypothetical protein GKR95_21995 [Gammaproteobacteria bacterium]|nr:hypothetical protein [Gammaproteobacteria bacterium]
MTIPTRQGREIAGGWGVSLDEKDNAIRFFRERNKNGIMTRVTMDREPGSSGFQNQVWLALLEGAGGVNG